MPNQILATGKPNIIITGAAGFLGSNLAEELVKTSNIIAIDNFITGNEKNIDLLLQQPNFEFIKHDITIPLDLANYPELKKFQIDVQGIQCIYHFACPTSLVCMASLVQVCAGMPRSRCCWTTVAKRIRASKSC